MIQSFEYNKDLCYYPTHAIISITDDCNLECKYCFTEHHPHYMDLTTAKAAADWVYQNLVYRGIPEEKDRNRDTCCELYFFGGEPLLCYDSIIVPLVEYCNNTYPNLFYFGCTTNGTLLTKEKVDFFKKNNFCILLSIDGNEQTQITNRPCRDHKLNSYNLLKENIPYILENFPDTVARATIDPLTVDQLYQNYLEFEKLGFSYCEFIENARGNWTEKDYNILENEFSKIYTYRLNQLINHCPMLNWSRGNLWLRHTFVLSQHYKTQYLTSNNNLNLKRCGLGTYSINISYDGTLTGCQEWATKNNKDIFEIGNIFTGGIDIKKHSNLLAFYNNESELLKINLNNKCRSCFGKEMCSNILYSCPSVAYELFNKMSVYPEVTCKMRQIYLKNSLLTLKILLEINDEIINEYLYHFILEIQN